ncbi:hypothetical protein [uncultured Rikenella sp.]|uniref:hypothetical protein n=1 Tax=uncultured Rikenella sp. TaxID=368003 RepID=UPI0025F7CB13|nr:hypothetical protein [uncultured Rikenella sp.]
MSCFNSLRLFEPRSSPPPHAADCNSTELVTLTAGGEPPKPAPGFRGNDGAVNHAGNYGFSWSSSSIVATDYLRGFGLSAGSTGLAPNSQETCGLGIQLRCLSE